MKAVVKRNRFLIKPFGVLLAIYLLGVLAILLAGVHYADDIARTNHGYTGWSGFSRYLSTFFSHWVHADNYLANVAPLPQLIAITILAAAGVLLVCIVSGKEIFKEKWTKWIWRIIAVVPLGLCPYMLECMSYQYDAPYMALSVFFAIMPLAFRKRKRWVYALMTAVGILVVCMTYQASIGIYPMLVIFLAIKDWHEKKNTKESVKFVGWSVVMFAVSVLLFQKILMRPREAYVSNDLPGINEFFPDLFAHLGKYYELVLSDFRLLWLIMIAIIVVCFVIWFTVRSKRNKVATAGVAIVGVVLMMFVTYAMYAALEKPLFEPRAMYAIGALIAILGVYIVSEKGWQMMAVIPVGVLAWCFFVFGFTYGNALKEQNTFRDNQVNMIISDLNEILAKADTGVKNIKVSGEVGLAPVLDHMPEREYRIVYRLLKPSYGTGVPWVAFNVYVAGLTNLSYDERLDLTKLDLPVIKDTVYYTIKGDEKNISIELKGNDGFKGLY